MVAQSLEPGAHEPNAVKTRPQHRELRALQNCHGEKNGGLLISLLVDAWLVKQDIFRYFTVKKTRFPLPAERFSTIWMKYTKREKMCLRTEISRIPRGIKGSKTFRLILCEKNDSPRKQYTSFPLVSRKCCRLLGKLAFDLHDRRNSRHFYKLEAWRGQNSRMLIKFYKVLSR